MPYNSINTPQIVHCCRITCCTISVNDAKMVHLFAVYLKLFEKHPNYIHTLSLRSLINLDEFKSISISNHLKFLLTNFDIEFKH